MTPLLLTASTAQSNLIKALVPIRADAGAKTFDGKTILDLTSKNSMGLCKWLEEHAKTKDGAKLGWQTLRIKPKRKTRLLAKVAQRRPQDLRNIINLSDDVSLAPSN